MRAWPQAASHASSLRRKRIGSLGGRFTVHDTASVNTGHGRTTFHPFPIHYELFAVCPSCRHTIALPIVSTAGQQHRVGILPVALLWRRVPGLGRHGLRRILGLSLRLLTLSRMLGLRRILGLGHCERGDETQRGHGASNGSAHIVKHGDAPYRSLFVLLTGLCELLTAQSKSY